MPSARRSELQANFTRGMNSGRVPGLIGVEQFAYARNVSIREGRPRSRARWARRLATYAGTPQGIKLFGQTGELCLSIDGHFVLVNPRTWSQRAMTNTLTKHTALRRYAYFCETDGTIIKQDGQGFPFAYDGSTFRLMDEDTDTLPIGTVMAYANGRLAVAVGGGRIIRIGDIRDTHQSELNFTETSLLTGGDIAVPDRVRAMAAVPVIDTASGQGPLLVGLRDRAYSIHTEITNRSAWQTTDGFVSDLFPAHGIVGHGAVTVVNQDLYFRSLDGLRSLRLTVSDYAQAGATPISREMAKRFDYDTAWMLDACSMELFDNRLFITHSPRLLGNYRPVHAGVVALNFDTLSEMGQKAPPAYDGEWAGVEIVEMTAGLVDGERRLFALCREGDANSIWEFLPEKTRKIDTSSGDFAQDDPLKTLDTRVHYGEDIRALKALQRVGLCVGRLRGRAIITVSFRVEGAAQWTELQTFKVQQETSTFDDPKPEETRHWLWSNLPAETRDEKTGRPVNVGIGHQLRFQWCGDCDLFYALETEVVDPSTCADNPVESVDLSAATCDPELPDAPTSESLTPSLEVYLAEFYGSYGYEGDAPIGDELDLGSVFVGEAATKYLILYNAGGSDLVISSLTLFAPFAIVDQPDSLVIPPGGSEEIGIRGIGYDPGSTSGTLTIASNDPTSPREIEVLLESIPIDFDPPATIASVSRIVIQPDHKLIVAVGAPSDRRANARLNFDGTFDDSWTSILNVGADFYGTAQAIQSDGRVIAGGGSVTIKRLNSDGSLHASFDATNGKIWQMVIQPDGKAVGVGEFTSVGGVTRNRIFRLNSDGTLDTSFNPNANNTVRRVLLLSGDRMLVCGFFTTIAGASRTGLAILNGDGTIDTSLPTINLSGGPTPGLYDVCVLGSGDFAFVGDFTSVLGSGRTKAGIVSPTGTLRSFNPMSSSGAEGITSLTSGGFVFGGRALSTVGGVSHYGWGFNADGSTAFFIDTDNSIGEMGVYSSPSEDWFYIVGTFGQVNGEARNTIARLLNNGVLT